MSSIHNPSSERASISTPPSKQPSHNACLPCRAGKVKCKYFSIHEACDRCRRNSLNCVFEQHRRGRKPGTRIKRNPPAPNSATDISLSVNESNLSHLSAATAPPPEENSILSPRSRDEAVREDTSQAGGWGSAGLQPVSILSKEAQSGKFSLENILCVPDVLEPNQSARPPSGYGIGSSGQDDPILFHILTFPVALGLFESFMRCLNPYISQLDPKLHTFDYIRKRSSFLLTTILSTSSKAFHPSLHPALRAHSEKLMGEAFVKGTKSTETVQAIMIFTYWKEADEMRTWLLVGYAIRMSIELGWHALEPHIRDEQHTINEASAREARNIERTWLVLFVYDRSLSLQLGKPWMIEQGGIILKASTWCNDELAVPGGDLVLAAFVNLRIISAEMLQLASPSRPLSNRSHGEILSKILNNGITAWEQDWLPLFEDSSIAPCHRFLVNFYGLHLRLLLNSYSLQASLAEAENGAAISKSALWLCSSSAISMLEQISNEFGPFKQLYFVQDSIHMMVAYAAIFLIKLLISLPKSMRLDFELHSIQAILKTAEIFEQQCATQMTGCAMQARFLKSVLRKYESLKAESTSANLDSQTYALQKQPSMSNNSIRPDNNEQDVPNITQTSGMDCSNQACGTPQTQAILGTNLFADKDLWDNLFSDVGFWMNEGNSLSDNQNMI